MTTSRWSYANQQQGSDAQLAPLHLAARAGHAHLVAPLLSAGAELEGRTKASRTPLITAALAGRLEVVRALLDSGADVAASTRGGSTALHGAATEGHPDVIALLLERGCPIDALSSGIGAVHHGAGAACVLKSAVDGVAGSLSDGRPFRIAQGQLVIAGEPLPWEAAAAELGTVGFPDRLRHYLGALDATRRLAQAGANLRFAYQENTAMHVFAEIGEPALVRFVADWTLRGSSGDTPSHAIATSGRADGVRLANPLGFAPDSRNDAGLTPIHF